MPRKPVNDSSRKRQIVAQEAARIILEHGVRDYRAAKEKAAKRLGVTGRGALPGNVEIEIAIAERLSLFANESHTEPLRLLRTAALSAMQFLCEFSPRLVGPVLSGITDENSPVNLHVFADSAESVAMKIGDRGVRLRSYERRLKSRHGQFNLHPGFEFQRCNETIQATVFPIDGIRQAPISPINNRPMKRIDSSAVRELLQP